MTEPEKTVGSTDDLAQPESRSSAVNSTYYLAQVEAFFSEQLNLPDPKLQSRAEDARPEKLSKIELVKVRDLCEDVMDFATQGHSGGRDRPTLLGWFFAWYERVMSSPWWPPSEWTIKWPRPLPNPMPGSVSLLPTLPLGEAVAQSRCVAQFELFDGLSRIYGGRFRGSVVFNCILGVIASTAVLYSLVQIFPKHDVLPNGHAGWPITTFVELACLILIGITYYLGSTPDIDDDDEEVASTTMRSHFDAHRWHQRWLEYRILAERFRYIDFLLPWGHESALSLVIAPKHSAGRMWHQRYFEWCVASPTPPMPSARQYRNHALAVIAEQDSYHDQNQLRRGTIAHRLHSLGKWAFIGALAICVIDIAIELRGIDMLVPGETGPVASWLTYLIRILASSLPFFGGWLPVVAAAAYAIVTHAEYAKAADASAETRDYIRQLQKILESMPVSDADLELEPPEAMRSIVGEFVATAIAEATGWRAMLRDKNVPLV